MKHENNYKFSNEELSKIFFTSDTHFNHANIIKYCNRPFRDIKEMNIALIDNWNKVVPKDGTVFHLGDFAFGGFSTYESIRPHLNGNIVLITGNHDIRNINVQNQQRLYKMFEWVGEMLTIHIEKRPIILSHYPLRCYPDKYYNLFGHIHSGPNATSVDVLENIFKPTQYDVGVDNNNYTPVSWLQIKNIINNGN